MHSFGAPRASRAGGWDVFVTLVSLADARLAPDCALARWQAMAVQQEQQMAAQQPQYNHFLVCGNQFCVDAKYTPLKPLGKGANHVWSGGHGADPDEGVGGKSRRRTSWPRELRGPSPEFMRRTRVAV